MEKKNIIAYKCKKCNEFLEEHLIEDHKKETDHEDFEPIFRAFSNVNKEISAFKCKYCGILLQLGECGNHRLDTGHKEFEPLYDKNINKEKNDSFR